MWRAAAAVEADILVFLDADSHDFTAGFLTGLLGPLLLEPGVDLVKGAFERPLSLGGAVREGEGGRVTELVARPLLNLHFPALAGFAQPLAGEIAIRRDLFARMRGPGRLRGRDRDDDRRSAPASASTPWPRSTSAPARTATSACGR